MAERPGWQTVSRRGDGHAVLVLPGLGGNDASTAPLRWFIGRHVTDGLDELLAAKHERGPVSVVGWSLGGVHAIELAPRRPDAVRCVVTLGVPCAVGSPTAGHPDHVGVQPKRCHRCLARVAVAEGLTPRERRVRGSHLGLGHNPGAAVVVADRLAQKPETGNPSSRLGGPAAGCRRHDDRTQRSWGS